MAIHFHRDVRSTAPLKHSLKKMAAFSSPIRKGGACHRGFSFAAGKQDDASSGPARASFSCVNTSTGGTLLAIPASKSNYRIVE